MHGDSKVGLRDVELQELVSTRNELEWNAACDRVKALRGGVYPHDWFEKVLFSGLLSRVSANWDV